MHSTLEENYSPGILVHLVSAVVSWISGRVSSNAGRTRKPQIHLGIIHSAVEVLERSAMVFIDHICHVILKRKSAPWGSFRTPRRERLMADIVIISMLYESTAIVCVNGLLYVYQFIYLQNIPLLKLLRNLQNIPQLRWLLNGFSPAYPWHRDSLSEYSSYSCLAQKMEKTHFGCDD